MTLYLVANPTPYHGSEWVMAAGGSCRPCQPMICTSPLVAVDETATRTGTCQANTLTPAASSTITHAVSSKSGGNTYTYDCNGNAIGRGGQTLIYDEENRLVEVQENSVTFAEYVYDGDGNRVKATVTAGGLTITTLFIGSYYEQIVTDDGSTSTTEWKKYYYAGAVRLAMREDADDPLYLIGDHLGSTSLVVDPSGLEVAKRSYLPFGEEWGVSATELPTTFTYTGQREAAEIGLMYYVARWYDSEIGHFIQADTIVPSAGNVLAWNRYAYVYYSPSNSIDPSGHMVDEEGSYNPWKKTVTTDEGVYDLEDDVWIEQYIKLSNDFELTIQKRTEFDFTTKGGAHFDISFTIDDVIDVYIDCIGIGGDIIAYGSTLDPAIGDEIPGWLVYFATEGIEIPGLGKAIYDAIQGDSSNLTYELLSNQIEESIRQYSKNANIPDYGRLAPGVGFIFNLISLSQNIQIGISID